MKIRLLFLLAFAAGLVSSCGSKNAESENTDLPSQTGSTTHAKPAVQPTEPDTTPRVTGIGGIFFKSNDTKSLNQWYADQLGIAVSPYGSPFEFRNAHRPDEINYLIWALHGQKSTYFEPSLKDFMINYRVNNLDGLLRKLKAAGVTVLDTVELYDYGKFVHILDPEGNKIELWEPIDSSLTKMGGKTTK